MRRNLRDRLPTAAATETEAERLALREAVAQALGVLVRVDPVPVPAVRKLRRVRLK